MPDISGPDIEIVLVNLPADETTKTLPSGELSMPVSKQISDI